MEWKVGGANEWEAATDKWAAKVSLEARGGWTYQIHPVGKEEPNCMGNGTSAEVCKAHVLTMIDIMDKWE